MREYLEMLAVSAMLVFGVIALVSFAVWAWPTWMVIRIGIAVSVLISILILAHDEEVKAKLEASL